MAHYELVVRNGTVATAGEVVKADIGVNDGRIVALGEDLGRGDREIDAAGKVVTPGGVDSHCHLDQPMSDGSVMADDFESGTISAAFGGTTTVIPQLTGWPETTISRGVVVCDGGELKVEVGRGAFLRCATPEPAMVSSEP